MLVRMCRWSRSLNTNVCPAGDLNPRTSLSTVEHANHLKQQLLVADQRLFRAVISDPTHVLRKHLTEVRQLSYNLWPRPHGFLLPSKDDRNFISRLLYKDMY